MTNFTNEESSFSKEISRDFFKSVYSYMFGALSLSGAIAYLCGTPEFFMKYFVNAQGISTTFYVAAFAPLGLALLIQWGYNKFY